MHWAFSRQEDETCLNAVKEKERTRPRAMTVCSSSWRGKNIVAQLLVRSSLSRSIPDRKAAVVVQKRKTFVCLKMLIHFSVHRGLNYFAMNIANPREPHEHQH